MERMPEMEPRLDLIPSGVKLQFSLDVTYLGRSNCTPHKNNNSFTAL